MIRFTATRPKCEKRRFSRIIILGHNWLEKRCTNWVLESIIHIEVSHGSLFVDFEAAKSSCSICKVTFLPKNETRMIVDHLHNGQPASFFFLFFLWKSKSRAHVGQLMQRLHRARRWVTKWEDMMVLLHLCTKFLLQSCRLPSGVNIFLGAP